MKKLTQEQIDNLNEFQKAKIGSFYHRYREKWTKGKIQKILKIQNNPFYNEYYQFALDTRETTLLKAEERIAQLYKENKELINSINFQPYVDSHIDILNSITSSYKKWEGEGYQRRFSDDLFSKMGYEKFKILQNYLDALIDNEEYKLKYSVLSLEDNAEKIKRDHKPCDYYMLFSLFYNYYKDILQEKRKKEISQVDYNKLSKFVKKYYDLLEKLLRNPKFYLFLLQKHRTYYENLVNEYIKYKKSDKTHLGYKEKEQLERKYYCVSSCVSRDLKPIKSQIEIITKNDTENAINQFISKNTYKVSKILEQRNDLTKIEDQLVLVHYIIEGNFRFIFENGDEFTVRNQLVLSYSKFGLPFYRFPTTFHDVKKGNTFQKMSSQQWMNENFHLQDFSFYKEMSKLIEMVKKIEIKSINSIKEEGKEVWWLPEGITPRELISGINDYEDRIDKIVRKKFPSLLLNTLIYDLNPYEHINNYSDIMKNIAILYDQYKENWCFKDLSLLKEFDLFWNGVFFGDCGDLDEGMVELTLYDFIKSGIIRYEHSHSGFNVYSELLEENEEATKEFYKIIKNNDFIEKLEEILQKIEFKNEEIPQKIAFVMEDDCFIRYLIPDNIPKKEIINKIKKALRKHYDSEIIIGY